MRSIGIDYAVGNWKTCVVENGEALEFSTFGEVSAVLDYIQKVSDTSAETSIALASRFETTFGPLAAIPGFQLQQMIADDQPSHREAFKTFLIRMCNSDFSIYRLPAIKYLPTIPPHRKLYRTHMGASNSLCSVTTLLYRMRQQEAAWPEMSFFFLEVSPVSKSIVVVKDGSIVDALGEGVPLKEVSYGHEFLPEDKAIFEQAFWESLTQDVAGLMALHHLEDIVVVDRHHPGGRNRKETVIDRLSDNYQLYLFPQHAAEPDGFESAIGAALIAEGLCRPGLATEVVERLRLFSAT